MLSVSKPVAFVMGSLLSASSLAAATSTQQRHVGPPCELRIVASIDGQDELFINPREARVEHHHWGMPAFVSINGQSWHPRENVRHSASKESPFFADTLDLAGGTATLIEGRGQIAFRHEGDDLVLTFDDGPHGGADEYVVLVEFADVQCDRSLVVDDVEPSQPSPRELLIRARIDGRDELHLGPHRADWLHLKWSWPTDVRIGDTAWNPRDGAARLRTHHPSR